MQSQDFPVFRLLLLLGILVAVEICLELFDTSSPATVHSYRQQAKALLPMIFSIARFVMSHVISIPPRAITSIPHASTQEAQDFEPSRLWYSNQAIE